MVTLLQLQRCYGGGNRFNELSYIIGEKIRNKDVETIRQAFNDVLIDELREKLGVPDLLEPFSYAYLVGDTIFEVILELIIITVCDTDNRRNAAKIIIVATMLCREHGDHF